MTSPSPDALPDFSPITVLAVDDNVIVRTGLVSLLEAIEDITVVAEATNGAEALELARLHNPTVTLLDVRMPVRDGISTVEELSGLSKVIMLTHTEDADIIRSALRKGASGYLVHGHFSGEELERALSEVARGSGTPLSPIAATAALQSVRTTPEQAPPDNPADGLGLTEREAEVLEAITRGLSNKAISKELFLTEKTVKNHINRIFRKLDVTTRAEAIARWNGVGP
ncbi:response regulator transcription factor [Nocardiopsis sp. RSe5-2]|uniref:Response regulator transcription factor n=1 Tax=Nocardiopsis endophytica TaxID=3018445 RepID=A0ABT4U2H3_9ACTN|nr:response regulator transcription factor [Nocardiopsis endophytica]MDA2811141.1 response regulator transcription factor [Nocardiopsis endophytica]